MSSSSVSVILPTKATKDRRSSLDRAVLSVLSQQGVSVQLIVVANGAHCDREILAELGERRDIRLVHIQRAGYSGALKLGRTIVDTPFFAELDDDDEMLPHALETRIERMKSDPSIDVVVTNGFIRSAGLETINIPDFTRIKADPLRALLDNMWLVPCAGLFRTDTVTADLFADIPASLEWTYLGLLLALKMKISFIDMPTFVYNSDTENSLSKSKDWIVSQPAALRAMLQLNLPRDVEAGLRSKYLRTLHSASFAELEDGNWTQAWMWHLKTLVRRGGWHYISYTRHLLRPSLFRDKVVGPVLGRLRRGGGTQE
jgi:glycosyltransferase involved in cell wall biosynthesis